MFMVVGQRSQRPEARENSKGFHMGTRKGLP
jgi:hypothetical protein